MSTRFRIPEVVRRYSGGLADVEVEGASVGAVLESLFARFPDLRTRVLDPTGRVYPYMILFVDGCELPRDGDLLDTPVPEGAVVEMIGAAEGGSGGSAGEDVRMRGFRSRTPVAEALVAALADLEPLPEEGVKHGDCAGRALAREITSDVDVPPFVRSAMDGYAVRAEDTFGASLYDPVRLVLVGESMPGTAEAPEVGPGRAVRIMTGAPVPAGADAVVRAEVAREEDAADGGTAVLVTEALPPGKNVGQVGEDVARGTLLLPALRRLRPQDAGLLASVGVSPVPVISRPRVRILVSGNELLSPGARPDGNRIVDSNTPMLTALVARDGGFVVEIRRVPDDRDLLATALTDPGVHVVVAAGGSSVGREDFLPGLVREHGDLIVHGVAMRPSAPTGIGRVGAARVFLLPGNPVSCLAAYDFFAGPAVRTLAGLPREWPYRSLEMPLRRRIVSEIGRTDYCRVEIVRDDRGPGAVPIAVAGASVLSSTTRADGFVVVDPGSEGAPEGATVIVHLYD